jgi:SRSO17 transposase
MIKVSPYPIPELAEFLRPYRQHFYRVESLATLERYVTGLLAEIEHKSGAGVAAGVAGLSESRVYRLLGESAWAETGMNQQRIETMGGAGVAGDGMLVVDDSGLPRQGRQCVGVGHQYCGQLGKVANCQVVVTLDYIDPYYSWPVLGQLYLPQDWCRDVKRRLRAQIPTEVTCQTKPEIGLRLIDEAAAAGIPFQFIGADGGYGDNPNFLAGLEQRELGYVVAVACDFGVCEVTDSPSPQSQAPVLTRADQLLAGQPGDQWQTIAWRWGQDGPLRKQFIARRTSRSQDGGSGPTGWLIGERPLPDQSGDLKFYWRNLAADTPLARLAELAHRRPAIERRYQDGKGLTGLGQYPARLWHSFHRHLAIEFLTLSWLSLQQPKPDAIDLVLEPRPVETADEPVFPLWPATLSSSRSDPNTGLSLSIYRVGAVAGSDQSIGSFHTGRSATSPRWRSFRHDVYLMALP